MGDNDLMSEFLLDNVCVIHNIPVTMHSRDLRSFFSQYVERNCFNCFHFRHRPRPADGGASRPGAVVSGGKPSSFIALVCLPVERVDELIRTYSGMHWVTWRGLYLSDRCRIARAADCAFIKPLLSGIDGVKALRRLVEFRPPPAVMPRGNVGTPTTHFLRLVRLCEMPARLIGRLGLEFPNARRRGRYTCVPHDYGTGHRVLSSIGGVSEPTLTAAGVPLLHQLPAQDEQAASPLAEQRAPRASDETDAAEQWDVHESLLDDDAHGQGRNKERQYEPSIEQVWEKGGPGLVWYTDEAFWRGRAGRDDPEVDQWDVDTVVYDEGAHTAAADTRQLAEMRCQRLMSRGVVDSALRRRDSSSDVDAQPQFDRHTRGFGRRLMRRLGWRLGDPLGTGARPAIHQPLQAEGQTSRHGIGFYGEPLLRFPGRAERTRLDGVRISTIFDDPAHVEEPERPDMSRSPTHMKYRPRKSALT